MKRRLVNASLVCLGTSYLLAGLMFLSTGTTGGVSLGLLFLGGLAVLYLAHALLGQLRQMRALLTLIAVRARAPRGGRATADQAGGNDAFIDSVEAPADDHGLGRRP